MKKLFKATIEFEIPIEAEDDVKALEYLKKNSYSIWNDFSDVLRDLCVSDLSKVGFLSGVDPDIGVYNNDEDLTVGEWLEKYASEEDIAEFEKFKKRFEKHMKDPLEKMFKQYNSLTQRQIDHLNWFQHFGGDHPFTCRSGRKTDAQHLDGEGILDATKDGWKCRYCSYFQVYRDELMFMLKEDPPQPCLHPNLSSAGECPDCGACLTMRQIDQAIGRQNRPAVSQE